MSRLLLHERRGPRLALAVAVLAVLVAGLVSPLASAVLAGALHLVSAGAGAFVLWRRAGHGLLPRGVEGLAPWGVMAVVACAGVVAALHVADPTGSGPRLWWFTGQAVAGLTLVPLAMTRAGLRQRVPGQSWADVAIAVVGLGVAVALCAEVGPAVGLGSLATVSLVGDVVFLAAVTWLRATRVYPEPLVRWLIAVAMAYSVLDAVRLLVPEPPAALVAVGAAAGLLASVHLVHIGTLLGSRDDSGPLATTSPRARRSRLLLAVPFVATVPVAGIVGRLLPEAELSPYLLGSAASVLMALALVRAHGLVSHAETRAERDVLTGLHDRRGFVRALEDRGHLASGDARMCLVDLDGFKLVNDRLGHAAGDALLVAIARRLTTALPHGTVVGRLGGDELVVSVHAPDVGTAAQAVLDVFSEPFDLGPQRGHLVAAASVGVADIARGLSVEEALRRADIAMYTAKESGRGRWTAYEEGQQHKVLGDATTLVELRALLRGREHAAEAGTSDPGRLVLHYQPVMDLITSEPTGLECLVRWEHPRRGQVPPDDFLPLAESAGLGADVDRWVLHTALAQLAVWDAAGHPRPIYRMAVNLGLSSVRSATLVEDVDAALTASGCLPERLLLEITEHDELPFDPVAAARLLTLKERGVSIALDDFGTGYSSVGYLRRWPVDAIKLDRSLLPVAGAESAFAATDDPLELLDGVVALAAALGHDVVAEGVEHADDDRAVRAVGVRFAQGWLYARPMLAEALEEWWRARETDKAAAAAALAAARPAAPARRPWGSAADATDAPAATGAASSESAAGATSGVAP